METHAARSTSTKENKLTSPPSRRSFAKRSPSTVLASRNLRRKRSPKGCVGRVRKGLFGRRPTMSVKTLIAMFATVAATFAAPTIVHAAQEKPTKQTATPKPTKSGHAAVNGVNYYYAVYGTGEPLLLLHGGLGQIEMFGPNLTKLSQSRQVIGVDLQGHGRTPLGDREISLIDMGNDMAGVVKKLTMPVILIYGDSDMIRPEHIVKFYQLLGGGLKDAGWQREHMSRNRLAILPNITHYEMGLAPQLVDAALPFLNGQGRGKSWDEQVSAK